MDVQKSRDTLRGCPSSDFLLILICYITGKIFYFYWASLRYVLQFIKLHESVCKDNSGLITYFGNSLYKRLLMF